MSYRNHQSHLEHRRVLKLAREYRNEGYDVTVYPQAAELPEPLSKCPLDLIAKGADKVIAGLTSSDEVLRVCRTDDL